MWATTVSSEILAPVSIGDDKIFVRTVDGSLTALSKEDGAQQWLVNHKVPRLSLRGTSTPVKFANAVLCGFDDGKVSAYDVSNGTLLWETMLTPAGGRTEIEKINAANKTLLKKIGMDRLLGFKNYFVPPGESTLTKARQPCRVQLTCFHVLRSSLHSSMAPLSNK